MSFNLPLILVIREEELGPKDKLGSRRKMWLLFKY